MAQLNITLNQDEIYFFKYSCIKVSIAACMFLGNLR